MKETYFNVELHSDIINTQINIIKEDGKLRPMNYQNDLFDSNLKAYYMYIISNTSPKRGELGLSTTGTILEIKEELPEDVKHLWRKIVATDCHDAKCFNRIPSIPKDFIDKYISAYNSGVELKEVRVDGISKVSSWPRDKEEIIIL
ncbi:MAG: hypothetical protein ACOC1K_06210 [Nanoarchaeota archaeon]